MKIYGISGLGADERTFKYLKLKAELIPLNWIPPLKNESIEAYSCRMAERIDETEEYGILGLSFGGLVATEISKKLKPKFTILLSTMAAKHEMRSFFKIVSKLNIIGIIPSQFFDLPRSLAHYLFGTKNKSLINQILDDTDNEFVKWATHELVNWKNEEEVLNTIRIHGTKDKIIPMEKNKNAVQIEGGERFMVVDRADEVSQIINESLIKYSQES